MLHMSVIFVVQRKILFLWSLSSQRMVAPQPQGAKETQRLWRGSEIYGEIYGLVKCNDGIFRWEKLKSCDTDAINKDVGVKSDYLISFDKDRW